MSKRLKISNRVRKGYPSYHVMCMCRCAHMSHQAIKSKQLQTRLVKAKAKANTENFSRLSIKFDSTYCLYK